MSTAQASSKTIRRRSKEIALVRDTVSGGAGALQLEDEVAALSREQRQRLLTSEDFRVEISAEDSLAMKADLVLPWNKIVMRR